MLPFVNRLNPLELETLKNDPRQLTKQETAWIREILQTRVDWMDADISKTQVIAKGPCDEGISFLLRAPVPENPGAISDSGNIGRVVVTTDDTSLIEIRLSPLHGRLYELFVLYVNPAHPERMLPERWIEVSHEAFAL